MTIIAEPDAYRIDGGATHIDIRSPEKALFGVPPDLQLADYPGAVGLYLVKFRGPMRPGWMDPLTKAGVRFIQYVHKNAYIVAASGGLSRLQSLVTGPVIFAGVYQPYYKLAAELRSADAMAATM